MTLNSKRISLICISALLALSLSGCGCRHEWQDATCQSPRICVLCGKTEGKVRAHRYANTACHEAEGCIYCGTTEGMELSHEWGRDSRICIHCGFDGRPADERFPDVLSEGLNERWQLEAELGTELDAEDWEKLFNTEYERLSPFKEETFENEEYAALAQRYIKSIEASIKSLEHFGTEQWADEYNNGAYWEQANVLFLLNAQTPVTVNEEHQEKLQDLLTNGEIINMVRPLLSQVMFLNIDSSDTSKKFETTLENTTSLHFDWFSLDVNVFDENGKVVDSHNIRVDIWDPAEKRRFSFTTDKEAAAIEVAFANWQLAP